MTQSVIEVNCISCSEKYHGVLQGSFESTGEYATSCPKCNSQTFIRDGADVVLLDISAPQNSVPVMFVKVI